MKKGVRGQVSLFIIIAIVVAIIVGFFLIRNAGHLSFDLEGARVDPTIAPVHAMVSSCLEEVLASGVIALSNQGGYYSLPENSHPLGYPYYIYEGANLVVTKVQMEQELQAYVFSHIGECLDFEQYESFEVDSGAFESAITITDDEVLIAVDFKIALTQGEKNYQLETFGGEIPTRLGSIHNVAHAVIANEMLDLGSICITCLGNLAETEDVFVSAQGLGEGVYVFSIRDDEPTINGENLVFSFAIKE